MDDNTPDTPEQWNALSSQIVALASFVGILAGALRAKGVMEAEEIEQVFQIADMALPEAGVAHGTAILATIRKGARAVMGEAPDDAG